MRGNDPLDVHVQVLGRAHPALDGDRGRRVARGILGDAGAHHVAGHHAQARGACVLGHHKEVAANASVQRHHGKQRARVLELAQEGLGRALQHVMDNGAPASPSVGEKNLRLVAVHGLAKAVGRHVKDPLGRLDHGTPRA